MESIYNKKRVLPLFFPAIILIVLVFSWFLNYFYKTPEEAITFDKKTELVYPDLTKKNISRTWFDNCIRNKNFQQGLYQFNYTLTIPDNYIDKNTSSLLVLPYIDTPAVQVYINDSFIGNQGDIEQGQSNIWSSPKFFYIPAELLKTHNKVKLILRGDIYVGVKRAPYLLKKENHGAFLFLLEFISNTAIWILCGSIFIMGLTVLFIGMAAAPKIDARLLLGAAGLCISVFMLDFTTIEHLPLPLIEFKRIGMILRHISSVLFIVGFLRLLENSMDKFSWLYIFSQFLSCLFLLIPRDLRSLKILYSYTAFTIIPLPLYIFILLVLSKTFRAGHLVLLSGVYISLISAIHDIFIPFLLNNDLYVSHYGFMMFSLSTSGFVVVDFMKNYKQLYKEKSRAETYKNASLRDPLTGSFNRNIIPHLIDNLKDVFSVIAVDLNEFKDVNDSYGHLTGDSVLKDLVHRMDSTFRREDYIIRYGGDEFLVILPLCPLKATEQLISKLKKEIKEVKIKVDKHAFDSAANYKDEYISYSISTGRAFYYKDKITLADLKETIKIADADMYENKRKFKLEKKAIRDISLN